MRSNIQEKNRLHQLNALEDTSISPRFRAMGMRYQHGALLDQPITFTTHRSKHYLLRFNVRFMGRSSRQIHQRKSLLILQSSARPPLHQTRWSFSFSVFHGSEDYFGWAWRSSPNTLLFLHRPLHVWFGQSCSELQAYGICFVFSQGFKRKLSKYLHLNPPSWSSSKHHLSIPWLHNKKLPRLLPSPLLHRSLC